MGCAIAYECGLVWRTFKECSIWGSSELMLKYVARYVRENVNTVVSSVFITITQTGHCGRIGINHCTSKRAWWQHQHWSPYLKVGIVALSVLITVPQSGHSGSSNTNFHTSKLVSWQHQYWSPYLNVGTVVAAVLITVDQSGKSISISIDHCTSKWA